MREGIIKILNILEKSKLRKVSKELTYLLFILKLKNEDYSTRNFLKKAIEKYNELSSISGLQVEYESLGIEDEIDKLLENVKNNKDEKIYEIIEAIFYNSTEYNENILPGAFSKLIVILALENEINNVLDTSFGFLSHRLKEKEIDIFTDSTMVSNIYTLLKDTLNNNKYEFIERSEIHKKDYDLILSKCSLNNTRNSNNRTSAEVVNEVVKIMKKKAIVIVNEGFLTRTLHEDITAREYLINKNLVQAVISLPEEIIPYNKTKLSILVLNKKKDNEGIYMMDLEEAEIGVLNEEMLTALADCLKDQIEFEYVSKLVNLYEIKKADYYLGVNKYIAKRKEEEKEVSLSELQTYSENIDKVKKEVDEILKKFVSVSNVEEEEELFLEFPNSV